MRIGYFCYNLSGNGPRVRAQEVINAIAEDTDHKTVVLTSEPEKVVKAADETVRISVKNPADVLLKIRRFFRDCDVVHVPINVYQVCFVRLGYYGPLVAGIGPGLQLQWHHVRLGKLARIDAKISTHEHQRGLAKSDVENFICMAAIDTEIFHSYPDREKKRMRNLMDIPEKDDVLLYVGSVTEEQGAALVDEMSREHATEDTTTVVVGDGDLRERVESNENIRYEGFVANEKLPDYYNIADITLGPRKMDSTSNVGLESIACGTPFISTAEGAIKKLFVFKENIYVWAERTPEDVWETAQRLLQDEERYQEQVEKGLTAIKEKPVTLNNAIKTHLDAYESVTE